METFKTNPKIKLQVNNCLRNKYYFVRKIRGFFDK
jgi:hypothetical protein